MTTEPMVCLDVFDTLLVRTCGGPHSVFPLVAAQLRSNGLPIGDRVFGEARRRAESVRGERLGRPAALAEIADEVCTLLSLPPTAAQDLVAAEEDIERRVSVVLPGAPGWVEKVRRTSSGGRVAFVSDTPHCRRLVTDLLQAAGLHRSGDVVVTSADQGASKLRGQLFPRVAALLEREARHLHMVGDNPSSDVAAAELSGWSAQLTTGGRLTRYEALLDAWGEQSDGLTSWLAGSARLARLEAVDRGVAAPVAAVAAGVTAPTLIGFALWLVAQARRRGLRRLYFVARDGEVMLQVARPLLALLAPEIEFRYLYGSRQSWTFAGSAYSHQVLADWVAVKRDVTARSALARVGLTPDEVWAAGRHRFADPATADRPMDVAGREQLQSSLQREPLSSLVRGRAREAAETTLAYFRQEGLAEDVPSALVDVGWTGQTARAFDRLAATLAAPPVEHLFVGVVAAAGAVRGESAPPVMTGWLFDNDLGRGGPEPVSGPNVLVEMLCAGREGRLLRYERVDPTQPDGAVRPVLTQPANQPVLDWGLDDVRAVVARVTELVAAHVESRHLHVDLGTPIWRNLSAFWTRPTDEEARAWGSFPWEEETWPPYYPVAHRVSTPDVVRRLRRGDRTIRRHNSWRAGSAAISSMPWSGVLSARAAYERQVAAMPTLLRRINLLRKRLQSSIRDASR